MTESTASSGGSIYDRQLVTSRVLDGPRKLVFKAFSDAARLARRWGPRGFTNTFQEFNFRPGCNWRVAMHAPDGANFPNESVFVEVAPLERVVFKHISGPQFEMTITSKSSTAKPKSAGARCSTRRLRCHVLGSSLSKLTDSTSIATQHRWPN